MVIVWSYGEDLGTTIFYFATLGLDTNDYMYIIPMGVFNFWTWQSAKNDDKF